MAPQINWYAADGTTLLPGQLDFGYVAPGQQATRTVVYCNVGDAAAKNAVLMIAPVGTPDLEQWLTGETGNQAFSRTSPLSLGTLAPGAVGTVLLTLNVPAGAPLSSLPLMAQPGIAYDLER